MSSGNTVWILTSEHNDYDQHGAYFEAAFKEKPTVKQLAEYFCGEGKGVYANPMAALDFLLHVEAGGGRQDSEDIWYILEEVSFYKKGNKK